MTATYNAAATIRECIESVRLQGYAPLEHILVDGASTDNTVQIAKECAHPALRILSEPDKGIYDAWNKGIALARGEWISFLGADDIYLPGAVRFYMKVAAEQPEAEYLSGRVRWIGPTGRSRIIGTPWQWPGFQRYMTVAHVGSMHRRSLFRKYGQFDTSYRMVADYEMLLRARGELRAAYLPQVTAEMRCGGMTDSVESLDEAARAKLSSGGRARTLVEVERLWAKAVFYGRRELGG